MKVLGAALHPKYCSTADPALPQDSCVSNLSSSFHWTPSPRAGAAPCRSAPVLMASRARQTAVQDNRALSTCGEKPRKGNGSEGDSEGVPGHLSSKCLQAALHSGGRASGGSRRLLLRAEGCGQGACTAPRGLRAPRLHSAQHRAAAPRARQRPAQSPSPPAPPGLRGAELAPEEQEALKDNKNQRKLR